MARAPVAATAVTKNMSVTVKQIENGYLICKSGYVGAGRNQKYVCTETFSKTDPIKAPRG